MSELEKEKYYEQLLNLKQVDDSWKLVDNSWDKNAATTYVQHIPSKAFTDEGHIYYKIDPVTESNIDNQAKIKEQMFKPSHIMSNMDYMRQTQMQENLEKKLLTEEMIEKAEQEEFEKFMKQTGSDSKKSMPKPSLKKKVTIKKEFVPFPYMGEKIKTVKVKEKEEDIIINKDEELIINIEELADELAIESQKDKNDNKEYSELLKKYKKLILKHERTKKQ